MQKQICIPSDTGYSLKVYRFASAPFNMFSVVHNLYRLSVGLSIDENPIFIFHYKISDNRAIIKLETVTSFKWTAFFSGHRSWYLPFSLHLHEKTNTCTLN